MEKLFFSQDYLDFWTAVGTIATSFSMIALVITVILTRRAVKLSAKAMEDSMNSFTKTL